MPSDQPRGIMMCSQSQKACQGEHTAEHFFAKLLWIRSTSYDHRAQQKLKDLRPVDHARAGCRDNLPDALDVSGLSQSLPVLRDRESFVT